MPAPSSAHQTLSFLIKRLKQAGLNPCSKLGQNFLIDINLQHMLLNSAMLTPNDVVLEVGTGTGSLTVLMAQQASVVISVELDQHLQQLASEELHGTNNVKLILADILKNKNRLNPKVIDVVGDELIAAPERTFKLVANLPYNVATPIITNLLTLETPPRTMTVTIQKELADRIVAQPNTKDYGALSIWIQSQCDAEIVRVMSPSVFWPRPKVHSAIIHLRLNDSLRDRIPDLKFFHQFVRSMFFHRRKFLRAQLLGACKGELGKPEIDSILGQLGMDGTVRAETLDVDKMLELAKNVQKKLGA